MVERFEFSPHRREEQKPEMKEQVSDEILENGWQERLQSVIKDETAAEEIKNFKHLLKKAEKDDKGLLVIDGMHKDAILMAQAIQEHLRSKGTRLGRDISFAGQSVDNVITAAYGMSALVDPSHGIGHTVGYATGQGKELNPGARIVASTAGSMARLILNGKISSENVGALIIDGGDDNNVYNQLLISALKEQHDQGRAPLTVILSRRLNKVAAVADFFGVNWTNLRGRYEEDEGIDTPVLELPLPEKISYEDAEEPFHIKQDERSAEILNGILKENTHSNTMVFVRDDEMVRNILQRIDPKLSHKFEYGSAGEALEMNNHTIHIISDKIPLKDRVAIELGVKEEKSFGVKRKPRIIISTQPAEMLGVVEKFDVVIDTHRSKEKGGYYSISREEADRRASYTKPNGICYRLTTESEYMYPQNLENESLHDGFSMSEVDEEKFEADLRAAGKNPETFPMLAPRSEYRRGSRIKAEAGEVDPAVEQWMKALNIESHVAKLVDFFDKEGERDLALALAACIRESRVLPENGGGIAVKEYLKSRNASFSDLMLRLSALADYIDPKNSSKNVELDHSGKPMFNQQALSHMKAMLDRWGAALDKKVDEVELAKAIRGLDSEKLTEEIFKTLPERLVHYTDYGYKYGSPSENRFGLLKPGRTTLSVGDFAIVIGTTGKANDFITTSHPLTLEQAMRLMPGRVKIEFGEPYIEKRKGVMRVIQIEEIMFLEDHGQGRDGQKREKWCSVRRITQKLEGEAAQSLLDIEQKRKEAVERLEHTTQSKLRLPVKMIQSILDNIKVGAVHTSAQDRLDAFEEIKRKIAIDSALASEYTIKDPVEYEKMIDGHIEKLGILAKKAAKEAKWSPEWFSDLQHVLKEVPDAISKHGFAQEMINSGTSVDELENRVYDYILDKGMAIAQQGGKINLEEAINVGLDSLEV